MLSINIADEALLPKVDRAGCVSGGKEDQSELFDCVMSDAGVPMIANAPVVMECHTLRPGLFEMPAYEYLKTGEVCPLEKASRDNSISSFTRRWSQ